MAPLPAGSFRTVVTVGRIADDEKTAGTARLREGYVPTLDAGAPLSVTTAALPIAVVNAPFSFTFQSAEGVAPFFWCVMSGMLPEGLSLNVITGELSGTPLRAGEFTFMVQVTDSAAPPHTAARRYTLVVLASNGLLANPGLNSPYNVSDHGFVADGWTEFAWPGFNAPDFAGEGAVKVEGDGSQKVGKFAVWRGGVRQAVSVTPGVRFTARVRAVIVSDEVGDNNVQIGIGVADGVTADPTQIAVSDLRFDHGVDLEPDLRTWNAFEASFTPTQSTVTVFLIGYNVNAFDTAVYFDDADPVAPPLPLEIATATLPDGTAGLGYSQAVAATGGAPPYTWAVVSGVLPDGLALDGGSGTIAGTPTTPGIATFTLQAMDAATPVRVATRNFTIAIHFAGGDPAGGLLTIATTALPDGVINQEYSFTLAAAGGTVPLSWSWTADSGPFPNGLALDPDTGAIEGTPTATGVARVIVTVTDASAPAQRATRGFTLAFDAVPPLTITTTSPLPDASAGEPYLQALQAVNGHPPYGWCIAEGLLPLGLSLNAGTGQISGVAFVEGVFSFTVQVTDSAAPAHMASKAFTLQVLSGPGSPLRIRLVKLSGDGQIGLTNRCLHDPLVWRTENAGTGEPLAGIATQVDFTAGDGIIVEAPNLSTVTDDRGQAGVRVIPGPKAEMLQVRVSVPGDATVAPIDFALDARLPRIDLVARVTGPQTAIVQGNCGIGKVAIAPPPYGGEPSVPSGPFAPTGEKGIGFAYPGEAIETVLGVRVLDAAGLPAAGVEVRPLLIDFAGDARGMEGVVEFMPTKALTDAAGDAFFVAIVPPGLPYQLLRLRFDLPEFDSGDAEHTPLGCNWIAAVVDSAGQSAFIEAGQGQIALPGTRVANPLVVRTRLPQFDVIFFTTQPGDLLEALEGTGQGSGVNPLTGLQQLTVRSTDASRIALALTLGPAPLPRTVVKLLPSGFDGFAVGGPEVRVVKQDDAGQFLPTSAILYARDESTATRETQYYVEARVPVNWAGAPTSRVVSMTPCAEQATLTAEAQPPAERQLPLMVVASPSPDRFQLLRSDWFIAQSGDLTSRVVARLPPDTDVDNTQPPGQPFTVTPSFTGTRSIKGLDQGFVSVRMAFSEEAERLRARGLEPVALVDPGKATDAAVWPPMQWWRVMQKEEPVNVKLLRETKTPAHTLSVLMSTSGTNNNGIHVMVSKTKQVMPDIWEYRGVLPAGSLASQGLIPGVNEDNILEFSVFDYVKDDKSSFADGRAFRAKAVAMGFVGARGHCEAQKVETTIAGKKTEAIAYIDLESAPANDLFVKAAGVEILTLSYSEGGRTLYEPRHWRVENQADVFYYSGHGSHEGEAFLFQAEGNESSLPLTSIEGKWGQDLDLVIIAGCSLADVGNFNQGKDRHDNLFTKFPGQKLAKSGCKIQLGYNNFAPTDNHFEVNDFTKAVIEGFMDLYKDSRSTNNGGRIIDEWIITNIVTEATLHQPDKVSPKHAGYNACGIDTSDPDPSKHFYIYYDQKAKIQLTKFRAEWPAPPK